VNEAARQAQVARDPEAGGEAEPPAEQPGPSAPLTLEEVQHDRRLSGLIAGADRVMEGLGFTEHGFRHATLVARIAFNVLDRLGFDERTTSLACVAGYLHDIGNSVARRTTAHGALFAAASEGPDAHRGPDARAGGDREPRGGVRAGGESNLGGGDPGRQIRRAPQPRTEEWTARLRHPRPSELCRRTVFLRRLKRPNVTLN
jgi:hypothetical protein